MVLVEEKISKLGGSKKNQLTFLLKKNLFEQFYSFKLFELFLISALDYED